MTDTNKTQTGNNKDYSFNATNIVVTHRGVQGKGKNAGKSYLMGSFERKGKNGQPAKQSTCSGPTDGCSRRIRSNIL